MWCAKIKVWKIGRAKKCMFVWWGERDGVVETSQRNGKITHFINLTVNWMDSDEISACVIQHICEYMYGSYNSCRRNDRTAYARTHNLMTTCSNCDSS